MPEPAVSTPKILGVGDRSSGGYNAALLAELVGPAGAATTVDIDRM